MEPYRATELRMRTGTPGAAPLSRRDQIRHLWQRLRHPAWMGTLRRLKPLSDYWGLERGSPIDRYYVERFLDQHRLDIRGRVLEVRDSAYADRFGAGVSQRDVLDIDPKNPRATIIADLAAAEAVSSDQFDCFILTQTLQFIYPVQAALGHTFRILKPGGVLLATVPSISRIDPHHISNDYWRFTATACRELFGSAFGHNSVTVESYGNALTAMAFLAGMAREELSQRELDVNDPYFPVTIVVRAVKAAAPETST